MRTSSTLTAIALLSLACAHAPSKRERDAAEIHWKLGFLALQAHRSQEALREFDLAIESNDQSAEAYLGRALVYELEYGQPKEAEKDYRKAIALKPDLSEAHTNLGRVLADTGRLEEAVKEFDLALANPFYQDPAAALCNKGKALYQLGRRAEGLSDFGACFARAPGYCAGHRMLGVLRFEEGHLKEAIESFEKYAQYCSTEPDAWLQLGLAEAKVGEAQKARDAFERCAALTGRDAVRDDCQQRLEALR